MSITHRICNTKRHTRAYIIDGERVTRGAAVKMARRGHLRNVLAKRGPDGWYITSAPWCERKLYDLPVEIEA